jgi:hypothetical protein
MKYPKIEEIDAMQLIGLAGHPGDYRVSTRRTQRENRG